MLWATKQDFSQLAKMKKKTNTWFYKLHMEVVATSEDKQEEHITAVNQEHIIKIVAYGNAVFSESITYV